MNQIIKKQLEMCSFANTKNYNEETHTYYIPKYTKPKYEVGKAYLIQVSKEIINNSNHIIAVNWNHGKAPQVEYYKAYVNKAMGSMIFADCLEFNFETKQDGNLMFSGWLSVNDLTQLAVL